MAKKKKSVFGKLKDLIKQGDIFQQPVSLSINWGDTAKPWYDTSLGSVYGACLSLVLVALIGGYGYLLVT